jgi:hypothetical protein
MPEQSLKKTPQSGTGRLGGYLLLRPGIGNHAVTVP